ncbi:GNAT family N-acetyltransferase [Chloroflexota bacterium]
MVKIQNICLEISADTGKFEPGFWLSPGFESGKNIIIAENADSKILGYAATLSAYYSNTLEARVLWIDLRTDPDLDKHSGIKDKLLERIIHRGYEIKVQENRERAAVGATYFSQGQASIDYLKSRGFKHFETILAMRKNLSGPINDFERNPDIEIKSWKMEARADKIAYLAARELAFGYPLGRLDLLEHFTDSELWQGGTTFTGFSNGKIVASVMVLSNGLLDFVFVIPEWRGKGIAKDLICEGLKFLEPCGHSQAWLEVLSHNQAAVRILQRRNLDGISARLMSPPSYKHTDCQLTQKHQQSGQLTIQIVKLSCCSVSSP